MSKQSSASAASSPLLQFFGAGRGRVHRLPALKQSETGGFDAAPFTAYVIALLTLLDRLRSLSGVNANIQRGLAAAESIFGLIDERAGGRPRHASSSRRLRGELELRATSRRATPARSKDALAGVSLRVAPGESVALVGPSGSGKIDAGQPDSALLRADRRAASCSTATTSTRSRSPICAATSRW